MRRKLPRPVEGPIGERRLGRSVGLEIGVYGGMGVLEGVCGPILGMMVGLVGVFCCLV